MAMTPDVTIVNYAGDAIGGLDTPGVSEHMPDIDGAGGLAEATDGASDLGDAAGDVGGDVGDAASDAGGFFDGGLDIFD